LKIFSLEACRIVLKLGNPTSRPRKKYFLIFDLKIFQPSFCTFLAINNLDLVPDPDTINMDPKDWVGKSRLQESSLLARWEKWFQN
jgi:hypothetical protein